MPSRRSALVAALALVVGLGCGRPKPPALQVATSVRPGYEPLYLARDLGALPAARFRLVEMPNATDVLRALRAGLVDAAAVTLDETLTLAQQGVDLRIVLVMDVSNGADALLARPGIGSLAGLKARRIGVERSAVGAYLLARALDHAGLPPKAVTTVQVAWNAQLQAYRSGAVDAVVTYEPNRSRLVAEGAEVLFDSRRIPEEIFDVLVMRGEALRARPEAAEQVRTAWFQALDHLRRTPEDAAKRMAPREGITHEALLASLRGLDFPDREQERRLREGALLIPARRLVDTMLSGRLLERHVDPAPLLSRP